MALSGSLAGLVPYQDWRPSRRDHSVEDEPHSSLSNGGFVHFGKAGTDSPGFSGATGVNVKDCSQVRHAAVVGLGIYFSLA